MAWSTSGSEFGSNDDLYGFDGYEYEEEEEEGDDDEEEEDEEAFKVKVIEMAKERLVQLYPFQHGSEVSTESESLFMVEAKTCLDHVHAHEAVLEFIATMPDELEKQRICRMILDLFNTQREQQYFPARMTNKYANHVLVCIIEYLFECPSEEWMGHVMDIVNKAHHLHLKLRKIDHSIAQDRLKKLTSKKKFAQRPGKSTCDFYMDNGFCRFGEDCRFHHPTDRLLGPAHEENREQDEATDMLFDDIARCQDVLLLLENPGHEGLPAEPAASADADSPFAELVRPKNKRKARPPPPRPGDEALRRGLVRLGLPAGAPGDQAARGRARDAALRLQQVRAVDYLKALAAVRFAGLARRAEAVELAGPERRAAPPVRERPAANGRHASAALREDGRLLPSKVSKFLLLAWRALEFSLSHTPSHSQK
jgi:hypothetical protein